MRNLTISALALLSFATSFAQTGDTWVQLRSAEDPQLWPAQLEAIHMCHIPPASGNQYGRIVMWGHGFSHPGIRGKCTQAFVWDTAPDHDITNFINQAGGESLAADTNMKYLGGDFFCGGHTGDKDGNLFAVGGQETGEPGDGIRVTARFDHVSLSWSSTYLMTHARWYPTVLPLSDGTLLAVSGKDQTGNAYSDIPERFTYTNPNNAWSIFEAMIENTPGNPEPFKTDLYPFMFTYYDAANDKAIWAGKRLYPQNGGQPALRSHQLNLTTKRYSVFPTNQGPLTTPAEGSGAVIWIDGTSPVRKGKVIKMGGNGFKDESVDPPFFHASAETWKLDLDGGTVEWAKTANMHQGAIDCNMPFLPDGKLLVVGGAKYDHDYMEEHNQSSNFVRKTQLYDPASGTWAPDNLADMPSTDYRGYHSAAVLLPDGSVLIGGTNNEYNGSIYYPEYFDLARPTITSVQANVGYDTTFPVDVVDGQNVLKVTLIRLGATTHGFDQGQRFIRADYTVSGNRLTVTSPKNGSVAPQGYYMLFVIGDNGAPSHARYVKIG